MKRYYAGLIWLCALLAGPVVLPTTSHAQVNCTGVAAWSANSVSYAVGNLVTYEGSEYKCLQAHTSQTAWNPVAAASLWSLVGACATTTGSTTGSCSATPGAPATPTASGTTSTTTNLSWGAVTAPANCTITGYEVYKNGTALASTTSTSYPATGLTASTAYQFTVAAVDSDGTGAQSAAVNVTTSGASEGPYGGTDAAVPGTVQAENYDTGGQGVGYSVTSVNGSANSYRSDGVDLETTTDTGGGYDIGWTAGGQWFRYTVNVATAGTYTVSLRLASPSAVTDGLHIANSSGTNLSGSVNVPATGGYQTWTTVTASVTLPAGPQTLTVDQDNGGYNINYIAFASAATCSATPSAPGTPTASGTTSSSTSLSWGAVTPPANCTITGYEVYENGTALASTTGTSYAVNGLAASTTYKFTVAAVDSEGTSAQSGSVSVTTAASGGSEGPYGGTAASVPGVVQAENYDTGGQGVGYSVTSVNGSANSYRSDGVDLETTSDTGGGYDLGWSAAGQWFRYTVNVGSAATYPVTFRVANGNTSNATLHLQNSSGTNLTGEITVPPTGGWQTFITVAGSIALPAGQQVLTLSEDSGGFNVNFFTIASITPTSFPAVVIPQYGMYQTIVAATTPQAYGAVANGSTDCTAAFQNAINAAYNSREGGGGVVYVPAGKYYFSGSLTIPTGVTLQGDWVDWTTSNAGGAVGTILMATANAGNGAASATPFIKLSNSATVRDVNIWYPNQNASSITPYPYSIGIGGDDCVVHDVALVNSYLGVIDSPAQSSGGTKFALSTVVGSPLSIGLDADGIYDVCHADDVRWSPNAWAYSGLSGAPAAGSSYASWMMANGTGIQVWRVDGLVCSNNTISGYNLGVDCEESSLGESGVSFYQCTVTDCNIALNENYLSSVNCGGQFSECTLSGVVGVNHSLNSGPSNCAFEDCTIVGTGGTAVSSNGPSGNKSSFMLFDNCNITGTLDLLEGVFNVTNSALTGSPQCTMSSGAVRAAFTGCTFSPSENIVNNSGNGSNLIVNSGGSQANTIPTPTWTTTVNNNYLSRQPAKTTLFQALSYGATGNGSTDDTTAIQNALNAAGSNGGGIVYLAPGLYHTSNSLTVPSGVELRGTYTLRHGTWSGASGIQQGAVIEPVGGQGSTTGPPAIVLDANGGVRGVSISYETQYGASQGSILAFPPAIQGRGANVYAIGIQCDNAYQYVDLDTYNCPNHLLYMVDGWVLNNGFHVGNGSSGTIAECHANATYWVDNSGSKSNIGGSVNQTPVWDYCAANSQFNIFGNCTENYWGSFEFGAATYIHFTSENGAGPNFTGVQAWCDGTVQGYLLDSTAATSINIVNNTLCVINVGTGSPTIIPVTSTSAFKGTLRAWNTNTWGAPTQYDFSIGGGNLGFLLYTDQQNNNQTQINGGVCHFVNGEYANGSSPDYNFTFGSGAGISGDTSELIGLYSPNGFGLTGSIPAISYWDDYALNSYNNL